MTKLLWAGEAMFEHLLPEGKRFVPSLDFRMRVNASHPFNLLLYQQTVLAEGVEAG